MANLSKTILIIMGFLLLYSMPCMAGGIAIRFGPPAVGTGGSNPVAIPPASSDLGISYVTDKGTEFNLAATGLSVAARDKAKWGGYTSLGAGLAFSATGGGLGPYAAFGLEIACGGFIGCFSAEYSQALGFGFGPVTSPSAVRFGVMKWF